MEENNKFKTRLCTQPGESKLDKDLTQKSLSHEEVEKEIKEKTEEILKALNSNANNDNSIETVKL